ncbi:Cytosolic iron-sulfur assembly component 2B, partial [Fragariocoptes setiger]
MVLENERPQLYPKAEPRKLTDSELDDEVVDELETREIFDIVRDIKDPEHPLTLEQLNIVRESNIKLESDAVNVEFFPTVSGCSMATLIGLSILTKLVRSLPEKIKINVSLASGTHVSAEAINKQLGDKERVAAAMENDHLLKIINQSIAH